MDKILLIVNGPLPVKVSANTILLHNTGSNPGKTDEYAGQPYPTAETAKQDLDLEIRNPATGKISKLSDLIKKEKEKTEAVKPLKGKELP